MNTTFKKIAVACGLALTISVHAADAVYSLTQLESIGSGDTWAQGINNVGQIVGASSFGALESHATLWNSTKATDLGSLVGMSSSTAYAINDAGQIVGSASQDNSSPRVPVIWQTGAPPTLLPHPGFGSAIGINSSGLVVGAVMPFAPTHTVNRKSSLVVWDNGQINILGNAKGTLPIQPNAINDFGVIAADDNAMVHVGGGLSTALSQATVWRNGVEIFLPMLGTEYIASTAEDINNAGAVVGTSYATDGSSRATLWQNGQVIDLGLAGGTSSEALDINGAGQVVGNYMVDGGTKHGVLWSGSSFVDLSSFIDPTLLSQGWLFSASGINDSGTIIGGLYQSQVAGPSRAAMLTLASAVPEAQTWALMLMGLSLTVAASRQDKKKGPVSPFPPLTPWQKGRSRSPSAPR